MLAAAEGRAARAWGADWCRFIVNGSSQANQAMALGVARPGATVIVSRTIHQLAVRGLRAGRPEPRVRAAGARSAHRPAGRNAAAAHRRRAGGASRCQRRVPDRAVRTSACCPTSPPSPACARTAGVPLLVDGAWGAHLGFHPDLPQHALALGADALVLSTHKTLPAFTQSALLLARARVARPAPHGRGVRPAQHHQPVGRHLRVDRPGPGAARARRRRAARPHAAPGDARPRRRWRASRASG